MNISNSHFPGILSEEYKRDPYAYIQSLNKRENIIYDDTIRAYLAISYDAVRHILSNTSAFSTKPLAERAEPVMGGKVLAQLEGEEHILKRKILLKKFTGSILHEHYEPFLIDICNSLIRDLTKKECFDFIPEFCHRYALLTAFKIIGIDCYDLDWYLIKLKSIVNYATGFQLTESRKKESLASALQLKHKIIDLIEKKKEKQGKDLISFILQKADSYGSINDNEIVALSLNILLAASEPIDKVLGNCIYHLFRNNRYINLLINEKCNYNEVIQETLRITPPVHLIPRQVEKDTTFEGVVLKEGAVIFSLIPSANRDELYFPNPDIFDPERHYKTHLSYGTGKHACIGMQFANKQLSIALQKLTPILNDYKESEPPKFEGIYTRGAVQYYLRRI